MKKFLIGIFTLLLGLQCFAATTTTTATTSTDWDSAAAQKRLNNIAYVIIKSNGLPDGISIKVSNDEDANAYANINKEIYVYRGMLNYAVTDEELAAVLGHEMGHIINGHNAKQSILNSIIANITGSIKADTTAKAVGVAAAQQLSSTKLSRKDEFEADITSVDLLVKANYNPLALISVLNKICGNYIDVISSHPSGEKRLMNIYNYIEYNYPEWIKKGYNTESYKKASMMININVQERNASTSKMNKYKKEQEKLKKEKLKRAKKMLKSSTGWDNAYAILTAGSQESTSTNDSSNK